MNRRNFFGGIGSLSAGLILSVNSRVSGFSRSQSESHPSRSTNSMQASGEQIKHEGISAVEDLMREHGILRRVLFVYSEAAEKLRNGDAAALLENLHKATGLFRSFGEDYHEKKLEETFIFPAIKKSGGEASAYPDILITQHSRGRQITDYILAVTQNAKLNAGKSEKLIQAAKSMIRMYRAHASREDTVVFPAWKDILSEEQLDEMSEKFEEIEHQMFGEDGFENAVRQIASIESDLGMADLSLFTAPPVAV